MFKDKIIFQMKSNNPIQKAADFCKFLPSKNLFSQKNHLKSKISQLHDLSGTNSYYQKVYYCQSPEEVDAIKNRNLIKCTSLPKFQIIRENMNQITVKMAKYSFNGLQILIKNLKRPEIAKKLIEQIFKAVNTIQRFYGEFQITGTKIKADAAGNIAVWPTQNFEQCLPIKYSHNQFSNQCNIVQKIKLEKFLKQLKNVIAQVILETGTQKDQKQIYCKLDQLTKNILFGNLYNQEIFQKPEKQKFKEYNAKANNTNYRVEKKLEVSEFQYFFPKKHLGWRNSVAVVQCQQENQQRLSFQFGYTGSLEFQKIPNVFAGRMSNYQSQRTNFLRVKSLEKKRIEPIQKKVPQFIKQKQKIKTSPELREISKKWDKIDLEQQYDLLINGKSVQQKVTKGFSNVQQEVSIFFEEDEEQIDTAEPEQVEHDNFLSPPKPGSKKKTLNQFTITRTKSTFKIEKPQQQQKPQQNLFLPKLTVLQQNQLNEDFLKIFSSRKNIYQDGVLGMQNLQLKRQFMLLMD